MVHLTQPQKLKQQAPAQPPASVVTVALNALRECASVAPAGLKEIDFSDSDDDDSQITLPLFVQKLKALVDDHEIDSAGWSADGESVEILQPARLSVQLCKYFKASKLNSFVRQLHFYGFKKIGGKRNSGWVYSHKYFTQDGRMIHKVRRKTCGPDRQIQNLTLKVESLQGSLAETQRKMGDMASALAALLEQNSKFPTICNSTSSCSTSSAPSSTSSACCCSCGDVTSTGTCGGTCSGTTSSDSSNSGGGGGGGGSASRTCCSRVDFPGLLAPLPSKRSHPPSATYDFDHFALPKRARGAFPSFDDSAPFTTFEMLSPRLLSPRHPFSGGYDGGGGNCDGDTPVSLLPEQVKEEHNHSLNHNHHHNHHHHNNHNHNNHSHNNGGNVKQENVDNTMLPGA